jgi:hypothetical protein
MTTLNARSDLKAAVDEAIALLQAEYGDEAVRVVPAGQGGAWVEIASVDLGDTYVQQDTFLAFLLPFNLPGADIYPMFVRPDLARRDGAPLGEGTQVMTTAWNGGSRAVVQLSRRTRHGAFGAQTAPQKVAKVLEWLRTK